MNMPNLPLEQISGAIRDFMLGPYGGAVLWTGFVIALLNCFFGYPLRKVWGTLLGIAAGTAAGAGASIYFSQPASVTVIASAAGAFLGGAVCFSMYRVGLFVLSGGLTFWGLHILFPMATHQTLLIFIIIGMAVGILANIYDHIVIILVTSVGGGIWSILLLSILLGEHTLFQTPGAWEWIAGILTAGLGLIFQLKPWKKKGYWSQRRNRFSFSFLFPAKKKRKKKRTIYVTKSFSPKKSPLEKEPLDFSQPVESPLPTEETVCTTLFSDTDPSADSFDTPPDAADKSNSQQPEKSDL